MKNTTQRDLGRTELDALTDLEAVLRSFRPKSKRTLLQVIHCSGVPLERCYKALRAAHALGLVTCAYSQFWELA